MENMQGSVKQVPICPLIKAGIDGMNIFVCI